REIGDDEHHRQQHRGDPQEAEPELGAGAGIGADRGRIVVGGAGDDAGAERAQDSALLGWHALAVLVARRHRTCHDAPNSPR
nr:hypothetical protein [Tanacetum cinerariifolium]